jgi:hypothetical protein
MHDPEALHCELAEHGSPSSHSAPAAASGYSQRCVALLHVAATHSTFDTHTLDAQLAVCTDCEHATKRLVCQTSPAQVPLPSHTSLSVSGLLSLHAVPTGENGSGGH